MLASFKAPGFALFYAHSTFASVDMTVRMAVHGWLVLELSDDSVFWLGVFALAQGVGQLLFSMVAGAIVDRFQRRTVLLVEGSLGSIVAWSVAAATFFEVITLSTAIALGFLIGVQRATRFTASNRLVYDLVGPRRLINGASLWRLSITPMAIFGSLLAGLLIDRVGIWAAYALIGTSLVISLPFLALITVRGAVERSGAGLLQQTLDGIMLARHSLPLRTLLGISIVMETLGFAYLVMIPFVAKNVLEAGGTGMGFLQAGVGVGLLLATLVMAARGDVEEKTRVIFLGAIGAGLALIGFALSRSLPLSVLFAAAVMAFLNAYDLTLGALMQLVSPPHLRGRAVSLHSLAISFTALGGFAMGVAGGIVGVPTVLAAGGAGIVANSLLRRSALKRVMELPTTVGPPEAPE